MLIKNYSDDKFIRAYNSFSQKGSPFHLSDEEFYLYSLLFTNQMMDGAIRTNIDLIHQVMRIKFIQNETKNKSKIKSLVNSLIKKRIFILENDYEELKNNTLLELSINDIEMANDGVEESKRITDSNKYQNFSKIPFNKFIEFISTRDYYIYYIVSKWSKGCKMSYNGWAEIFGLKHQESAVRVIDDAVERGIIYKNIGQHVTRTQQEVNTYTVTPISEDKKTRQTKQKEQVKELEKADQLFEDDFTEKEIRPHNWNVPKSDLTEVDFYIYLTTNDEGLKKRADRRIEAISNSSEKGKGLIETLMQAAEYKVEQEEMKHEKEQEVSLLSKAKNAVRMKNGDVVPVDFTSVMQVDFTEVKMLVCLDKGEIKSEIDIRSFQPSRVSNGKYKYLDRKEMVDMGLSLYRNHIREGAVFDFDSFENMKSIVDEKHGISMEYGMDDQISLMNQSMEHKRKSAVEMANEIF